MVRFLPQVPRPWLGGAVFLAAALWGGAVLWRGGKTETPPRTFSGVRQEVTGVEYVEEDPRSGTVLSVRAARSVMRDGVVGKLFRTPLRPVVTLEGVRVELRDSDGRTLMARGRRGRLDPRSWEVRLPNPSELRFGARRLTAVDVIVGRDGQVVFPRGFGTGGGEGQGRRFQGPLAALEAAIEQRAQVKPGASWNPPGRQSRRRLTPPGHAGGVGGHPETAGP